MPLLLSICCGCLLPNSPDDIQCAAVINASKYVVFIEHDKKLPKTKALIIKEAEGHPGFSVWKDNTMLFDYYPSRRRSKRALLAAIKRKKENKEQTKKEQKRQEIIKEILYENS